jgi:pilus assembly protein Flp/PilA
MNTMLLRLYIRFQDLATREDGQDMVEYGMMVALISFGWIASVKSVATALNSAFDSISTNVASYVS